MLSITTLLPDVALNAVNLVFCPYWALVKWLNVSACVVRQTTNSLLMIVKLPECPHTVCHDARSYDIKSNMSLPLQIGNARLSTCILNRLGGPKHTRLVCVGHLEVEYKNDEGGCGGEEKERKTEAEVVRQCKC